MGPLSAAFRDRPAGEPRRLFASAGVEPIDKTAAARRLKSLDALDRRIAVLVYGVGLGLDVVSMGLRLDPALVRWRLHRIFASAPSTLDGPHLEASIIALLRDGGSPGAESPPEGESWRAEDLIDAFPETEQDRLAARMLSDDDDMSTATQQPGLGPGVLLLVGAAVAAFMTYGFLRDVNPMWAAEKYVRNGFYEDAFQVYSDYARISGSAEAKAQAVLCLLGLGDFESALERLSDEETTAALGAMRPFEGPLEQLGAGPDCPALLPRGHITDTRPAFLLRPSPPGQLELVLFPGLGTASRTVHHELEDTRDVPELVSLAYPDTWPKLTSGTFEWSAPGHASPASFTVMPVDQTRQIMNFAKLRLGVKVPEPARNFLRGHYYLRNDLYQQAAMQFAWLARRFPDADYPRERVEEISAALGVDPFVFLR